MSSTGPLLETARKLGEARRILEGVEATALGGVEQINTERAESPAIAAREHKAISPDDCLTFEVVAHLTKTPKAFEKVVTMGEILLDHLTKRGIIFPRKERDEWPLER